MNLNILVSYSNDFTGILDVVVTTYNQTLENSYHEHSYS